MAWNCLTNCVKNYLRVGIRKPIKEPVIMPWVELWFKDNQNKKISVSNFSSAKSLASIKSFQFGMSNGVGVTFEIIDEEGGEFSNFLCKITTGNLESGARKYILQFRFGWATMNCFGNARTFYEPINNPREAVDGNNAYTSRVHTMTVRDISADISSGVFKYTIEATDMTDDMLQTRDDLVRGESGRPMPVTRAVREMFNRYNIDVEFLRQGNTPGAPEPMRFKLDTGALAGVAGAVGASNVFGSAVNTALAAQAIVDGPVGVWSSRGLNPIQAARNWLNECVSDRNRGIIWFWDSSSTQSRPKLIFYESPINNCSELVVNNSNINLGTYIVNGGACSPVINFTPRIKFNMDSVLSGGSVGGAVNTGAFSITTPNSRNLGSAPCLVNVSQSISQGYRATASSSNASETNRSLLISAQNLVTNSRANMNASPISADLKVQGDPSFDTPILLVGYNLSIVYINPFRIGRRTEVDFLANGCQSSLSNSNWMIQGVSHDIREGSFTTSFKLMLAAPGLDISRDLPLGGTPGAPTICK